MAGVGEAFVLHVSGPDALGSTRSAGDGRGPGEGAQTTGGREPGGVVTDLAKDPCREDRTQPGRGAQLLGGGVLIELDGHGHLECGDRRLHRLDHVDQSDHRVAERGLDGRRLTQGRLVEVLQESSRPARVGRRGRCAAAVSRLACGSASDRAPATGQCR